MSYSVMTKKESDWVDKMNKLLAKCPSDRLGFFTIGDHYVCMFNTDILSEDSKLLDNTDLVGIAASEGALFEEVIYFPNAVNGVCG